MNTCDTCEWWGNRWFAKYANPPKEIFVPMCNNSDVIAPFDPKAGPEDELERKFSDSGSRTDCQSLYTGAKFGCIHWTEKPL